MIALEELARLRQVCRYSLVCLYLGTVEEVVDDVKDKVITYTDALEQKVRELEEQIEAWRATVMEAREREL